MNDSWVETEDSQHNIQCRNDLKVKVCVVLIDEEKTFLASWLVELMS